MKIDIKNIHPDYIEFENGQKYFHEKYVETMNERSYQKGKTEGEHIEKHVAEVTYINKPEFS